MERIEVFLTPQQHKKFMHHEPFQLSANQLKESDKHIGKKFHVELQLTKPHYKKLLSNVKAGKGYRFTKEAIMGGSLLGEMWNGAKNAIGAVGDVVNKVGEYIPADMIRKGVKTGLTAGATALGSLVGNPELGLMAAPLIDKGVDYAEKGYNYLKTKKEPKDVLQDAYETYAPRARKYVEDRIPAARRARELYDEYEPRVRKVYHKARRVYYQEPDDEEDDDEEDEYEPPPPPRRRKKAAPRPSYSPPAPSDYSGYSGRGIKLKKGSAEAKAWGAKMRAMRKIKGGDIPADIKKKLMLEKQKEDESDEGWIEHERRTTGGFKNPIMISASGGGLKKGSAAAKAWGAKMKAMRKVKEHNPNGKTFTADMKPNPYYKMKGTGVEWMDNMGKTYSPGEGWDRDKAYGKGGGLTPYEIRRRQMLGLGVGGDLWGDFVGAVSNTLDPNKNGVADALDPNKNGVSNLVNQIGDSLRGEADKVVSFYQQAASSASPLVNAAIAEVAKSLPSQADAAAFGKQIASALIHQGIPAATAAVCGALAEAAFPEGGPISAQLGSEVGKALGNKLADEVGKQTGYGLSRRRGHRQLLTGGTLHKGVPYPHYTDNTLERIRTHGLDFRHKGENGMYKGGSFAPLGGSVY